MPHWYIEVLSELLTNKLLNQDIAQTFFLKIPNKTTVFVQHDDNHSDYTPCIWRMMKHVRNKLHKMLDTCMGRSTGNQTSDPQSDSALLTHGGCAELQRESRSTLTDAHTSKRSACPPTLQQHRAQQQAENITAAPKWDVFLNRKVILFVSLLLLLFSGSLAFKKLSMCS